MLLLAKTFPQPLLSSKFTLYPTVEILNPTPFALNTIINRDVIPTFLHPEPVCKYLYLYL